MLPLMCSVGRISNHAFTNPFMVPREVWGHYTVQLPAGMWKRHLQLLKCKALSTWGSLNLLLLELSFPAAFSILSLRPLPSMMLIQSCLAIPLLLPARLYLNPLLPPLCLHSSLFICLLIFCPSYPIEPKLHFKFIIYLIFVECWKWTWTNLLIFYAFLYSSVKCKSFKSIGNIYIKWINTELFLHYLCIYICCNSFIAVNALNNPQ